MSKDLEDYNLPRNKIFLGGSCTSNWRNEIIPALDYYKIDYFNPVVDDWTPECIELENDEKNRKCNIHLYYFDSSMTGTYSVAELVKSCYDSVAAKLDDDTGEVFKSKNVDLVLFIVNIDGYSSGQIRSFDAIYSLVSGVTNFVYYKKIKTSDLKGELIDALREAYDSISVEYSDDSE